MSEEIAPASEQPETPEASAKPKLPWAAQVRQENERLRARIAELEAAQGSQPAPVTPTGLREQRRYRVSLPGAKVRVVDDQGRPQMQDHMDVVACSPADAFESYKSHNGITSTIHSPKVEPATV